MSSVKSKFYLFALVLVISFAFTDASLKSLFCFDSCNKGDMAEFVKAYKTIEEYLHKNMLEKKSTLSDIKTVVLDWLKVMEEKKKKDSLVRALRLFTSMFRGYDTREIACSWMYINILKRNLEIVQTFTKGPSNDILLIDILNRLGLKQAENCQMFYLNEFSEKYNELYETKRELVRHVETFTAAIIGERLVMSKQPELYHLFTRQTSQIYKRMILEKELKNLVRGEVKLALDSIQSGDFGVSIDHNTGNQSDELAKDNLAEEYLIKPCKQYVRALHMDVFGLAEFGSHFSPTMLTKPYHLTASYYMAFASFRICKDLIIQRQDEIKALINEEDTDLFRKKFSYE